jgi:hypothetical protein
MSRKSNAFHVVGVVLAAAWTLALLAIVWNELNSSSLVNARPKRRDNDAPAKTIVTAPGTAEMQPTSLPLPGGGLPIKATEGLTVAAAKAPHRLPDEIVEDQLPPDSEPPLSRGDPPAANRPRRLSGEPESPPVRRQAIGRSSVQRPFEAPENERMRSASWSQLRLRELMHRLESPDPTEAAAVRDELQRRGIVGPLFDLARIAAATDPDVRRAFVESLPSFSGVDARPWLLEMSYDDDSGVRAAAVTLMATSGDLDLLKRVQQTALEDPDDATRAQAEKALPSKPVARR